LLTAVLTALLTATALLAALTRLLVRLLTLLVVLLAAALLLTALVALLVLLIGHQHARAYLSAKTRLGRDCRYGASGEIVSRRIEEGQAYILRTRAPCTEMQRRSQNRQSATSELERI
jgi:hypothetical protein